MDCLICTRRYKNYVEYNCKHQICVECATRLIFLYKKNTCPLCKNKVSTVTYKEGEFLENCDYGKKDISERNYLDGIVKSRFNPRMLKEMPLICCYNQNLAEEIVDLLSYKCKSCLMIFSSGNGLKKHFKSHNRVVCNECFENRKDFWFEINLYSVEGIKQHKKGALNEEGFSGHVYCLHCSMYLYNEDMAKHHCQQTHILCSICDILGKKNAYYKDFSDLEKHYKNIHYCCKNAHCIANKCYAFPYKTELFEHTLKFHKLNVGISSIHCGSKCDIPFMNPFYKTESKKTRKVDIKLNDNSSSIRSYNDAKKKEDSVSVRKTKNKVNEISNSSVRKNDQVQNKITSNMSISDFNWKNTVGNLKTISIGDKNSLTGNTAITELPDYLDRKIVSEIKRRDNLRKSIISRHCKENTEVVCDYFNKAISKTITINECVKSLESIISQDIILKLLKEISFDGIKDEVEIFYKQYKNDVLFPKFQSRSNGVEPKQSKPKKPAIGFKVLDLTKKK